ncbi:hypothetical protein M9Y10_022736 [Tritrichomonas musculus]|uniref:Uncharacterized protein n=1 Tax=Tritrichomonas musculus TaxID=1915356 RepID=A0ABR2KU29_9EUKA
MNKPLPKVNQVFKAIGNEQLDSNRERFYRSYAEASTDDYYYKSFLAKKNGQKNFSTVKKITNVKDAIRYIDDDTPALGAVRLRHSSTSIPLVDSDINSFLPFDKNEMMLEQLWNYLLRLEELNREDNQHSSTITSLIRFIVHSLQFNTTGDAKAKVDPASHQRFAFFLNDQKGQQFLSRFLDIMESSFLKRFFFTSFIVFKDVQVDPKSRFAEQFLKRLVEYLDKNTPKPKWLFAFIRQAMNFGFVSIAKNEFKLACLASLILTARATRETMSDSDRTLLNTTMKNTAELIAKDLNALLQEKYDEYFMRSVFENVIYLQPDCELRNLISATTV